MIDRAAAAYAGVVTPRAGQEKELRADAARNRARILQVARGQLTAGDNSLQLNTVARLAGVGVGTVYRHFPNRHALVEALSAERFRELLEEAEAAAAVEDPMTGLRRLLRFTLDRMLDDPDFATVLESAGDADVRTSQMKAELDRTVMSLLDGARLAGAVRGPSGPRTYAVCCAAWDTRCAPAAATSGISTSTFCWKACARRADRGIPSPTPNRIAIRMC